MGKRYCPGISLNTVGSKEVFTEKLQMAELELIVRYEGDLTKAQQLGGVKITTLLGGYALLALEEEHAEEVLSCP